MSLTGYEQTLDAITDRALGIIGPRLRSIPLGTDLDGMRRIVVEIIYQVSNLHGSAAAALAVQHLLDGRGDLDLPTPEPSGPVSRGQVYAAVNALTQDLDAGGVPGGVQTKLEALAVKFVRRPANETVRAASRAAGTRFARKPEAGACAWCIMLASRGAVYVRSTVTKTMDGSKYHDGCRCTGVEVIRDSDIPGVVSTLHDAWQTGVIDDSMLNSPTTLYEALRESSFQHPDLDAGISKYTTPTAA